MITRRDASRLVLSGPALALLSVPGFARVDVGAGGDRWKARLETEMNRALAEGRDARFTVMDIGLEPADGGRVRMASVIQLDWPQGTRRRPFRHDGGTGEAAYQAMKAVALDHFATAWPGCMQA